MNNNTQLKGLLAAVPSTMLRAGKVGGDKPGLLAGETPVCRLPEGPTGEAYGALLMGAVNALPNLIKASERQAGSDQSPNQYTKIERDRIEQQISLVLGMRPGAKGSNSIWSRLIWTTIEPYLVPLPTTPQEGDNAPHAATELHAERIRKERHDAVLHFTCFITAQLATTPIEGEADVTKLFERWENEQIAPAQ
ncbi:MAG: hypothetical protein WC749_00030 [Dehalococcoidia bacterium]|uniref:hypothetical protein n=1 Tax=unclassified Pseudomonas TaxID=196821 RepID=UPI00147529EA|nr:MULTISPECIES: hypothetical protein [unclassified Pseudomonas]NMX92435.1 hypothetical protein [Pseudomonas sp. WS 5086]NMY47066.1 hypothetical protein [Pseudomonas sp. WS 5027]